MFEPSDIEVLRTVVREEIRSGRAIPPMAGDYAIRASISKDRITFEDPPASSPDPRR